MRTLKTKTLSWHHLQMPDKKDLDWIQNNFHFHQIVMGELTKPTVRPKAELFDRYIYMVLHFPIFEERERKTHQREIDFLITENELITVSYESIPPLDAFFKMCLGEKSCQELYASKTPAHLLFYVLKELFNFSLRELDHIQENVNQIEEKIFSGFERDVVEELSIVRRDIIDFRRAVKPQHLTLESLKDHCLKLFGSSLGPYFAGLVGEYQKVWNLLENNKEALDALYDNNTTLLNVKQNEIMKIFTILAFITFPLTLLVSILQINTENNPILGRSPYDFWIIVAVVVTVTMIMIWIFKKKNWI